LTARTGMLAAAFLAFRRDLLLAVRHWGQVAQPLVFFVMVTTLFPLALGPELGQLREIAAGTLWVAALLASLLGLELLFRADHADGSLEQLLLSGQPLAVLALAKGLAHWAVCGLPLVLLAPVVAVSLGMPTEANCAIMLSLGLGTGILSALGAIGSALTLGLRRGSLLLGLLVLPLAMPALIFGARAVDLAVHGDSARGPLLLLAAMLVLCVTLAPAAVAAALRISSE
jgi:heme exporter protein B